MKSKRLELLSYQCQCGMYFTEILNLDNGAIAYSRIVEDEAWNFFFGFTAKTPEQFEEAFEKASKLFKKLNRTPVFAISPSCKITRKVKRYIYSHYFSIAQNVTMLAGKFKNRFPLEKGYEFKRIDNKKEKDLFIETFQTSKSQTLPGDTYQPLPSFYATALKNSFDSKTDWDFIHFLSLYEGVPVGMASACVKDDFCGIYGGGTFVKHRGKGVFTNLIGFIYQTLRKNNMKFFGITEKGSKNEKYYNSIGWKTKFTTVLFRKK